MIDERAASREFADVPGGTTGLLCRDYKGRRADRLVTRIDPGVVSLVAELRGHERQAAEELGQRKTRVEEHKPLDASPTAIKPAARHGGESYELAIERYLIKRDEWLQQRCAEAPGPGAPRLADVVAALADGESYELAIERYLTKWDQWLQQRCAEVPGPGAPRLTDVVGALNQRIGMLGEVAALAP